MIRTQTWVFTTKVEAGQDISTLVWKRRRSVRPTKRQRMALHREKARHREAKDRLFTRLEQAQDRYRVAQSAALNFQNQLKAALEKLTQVGMVLAALSGLRPGMHSAWTVTDDLMRAGLKSVRVSLEHDPLERLWRLVAYVPKLLVDNGPPVDVEPRAYRFCEPKEE